MSLAKQRIQTVLVSGKGADKTTAFSNALNNVSKKVLKESSEVLLRIEPRDVTLVRAEAESTTERFLFFFFPRVRTTYFVELEVEVAIQAIDAQSIDFQPKMDDRSKKSLVAYFTSRI